MSEKLRHWNGEYPIFVASDDSVHLKYIDDEEELVEFCTLHQLNPHELQYYEAFPVYAWNNVYIDAEELENDDGELDEEVQKLIDEFQEKLKAIKRPVLYWASNSPFKISEAQLEEWYVKVKGNLA